MSKSKTALGWSGLALGLALAMSSSLVLARGPAYPSDGDDNLSILVAHTGEQVFSYTVRLEPLRLPIANQIVAESQTFERERPFRLLQGRFGTSGALTAAEATPKLLPIPLHRLERGLARPAATCVVTSTADSGPGTLRQCLEDAVTGDTITFDAAVFSPASPSTIVLSSALPRIITDSLTIDASDAGVVLDGSGLSSGSGFIVAGTDGVTIRGFQILHFPWDGVTVGLGAVRTIIGGDRFTGNGPLGQGNLLSDNGDTGVWLEGNGTMSNTVLGNYIGTDVSGNTALGNWEVGVFIGFEASNNTVGGNTPGVLNLISGNDGSGVWIEGEGTSGNQVLGNYIGTDASGAATLSNGQLGVFVGGGATNNTIGGDTSGARNLISGNAMTGVWFQNAGTSGNQVLGNLIGVDVSGATFLGNGGDGVFIGFEASDNTIGGNTPGAGNLISGNGESGVRLQNAGTSGNRMLGNTIGTNVSGTAPLGNGEDGVFIGWGASNNVIGGDTPGARNLISGNGRSGVWFQNAGTSGNQVLGNYVGTDISGTASLGNTDMGVMIQAGAASNIVGGSTSGAGNLISGNGGAGVRMEDAGTSGNWVQGNLIGTDISGTVAIGNTQPGALIIDGASNNTIGGDTPGARNLISGNGMAGVWIQSVGTSGNRVLGNYIGTDVCGIAFLGNAELGVIVQAGATNNIIGGDTPGVRNLISGNGIAGIWIEDAGTSGNQVMGNYIGTDVSGAAALGNGQDGVFVGWGAKNNTVGGNMPGARNLISGNDRAGVCIQNVGTSGNQVLGNYVGTNISGTAPLANIIMGVLVQEGATNNAIGGDVLGACNLISGNGEVGVWIEDAGTSANQISGNYIGTNISGTASLGNTDVGVLIQAGATNNTVGGGSPGARNLISGNGIAGVWIEDAGTSGNRVLGNSIGTPISGSLVLGNAGFGVFIGSSATRNTIGVSNTVVYNTRAGVVISGTETLYNTVTRNVIHGNGGLPIDLQMPVPISLPPVFHGFSALNHTIWGSTCPGCRVEVFASPTITPAGVVFLGDALVSTSDHFSLTLPDLPLYSYLAATATDPDGTTSEFSAGFRLAGAILTPTFTTATVLSGETAVYTHTLTNVGPDTDTFTLAATSVRGWLNAYRPLTATLEGSAATTVVVTLTVPPGDLPAGTTDRTVITATSELDPQAVVTATEITIVALVPGVALSPGRSINARPGSTVTYTHILTNTGNATDDFILAATSAQDWLDTYYPLTVTLDSSAAATVVATLTIPGDAAQGATDRVVITATSGLNPQVVATAEIMIVCEWHKIYLPLVIRNYPLSEKKTFGQVRQ